MRLISIGDDKGRDALVGIESCLKKNSYQRFNTKRLVKSTLKTDISTLMKENADDEMKVAEQIIKTDDDIDFINEGLNPEKLSQIYLSSDNKIINNVHYEERTFSSEGNLLQAAPYKKIEANVKSENFPIRWSGITVPIYEAARRYIFTHHYQLVHTNGLTYDFLYGMAKQLSDSKCLMYVGGGVDGKEPIILSKGGKKYRGFMSGFVSNLYPDEYQLFLHLTDIDLEDC